MLHFRPAPLTVLRSVHFSTCDKISIHRQRILLNIAQIAHRQQQPYSKYTNLSADFQVPNDDPWPSSVRGATIQISLFRRAHKAGKLDPEVVEALDEINFVWDPRHHKWKLQVAALKRYKEIYGDITVPWTFKIEKNDVAWESDMRSMKLGQVVANLRKRVDSVPLDIKAQLDELGFVWDGLRLVYDWEDKIEALVVHEEIFGHLNVRQSFEVPENDTRWPSHLWKMSLGTVVNTLRTTEHPIHRRKQLDALGFIWDVSKSNWETKILALERYLELHGHLNIPRSYQVIESSEWPEATWNLKLGSAVRMIQNRAQYLTPERLAQLDRIGFLLKKKPVQGVITE